MTVDIARPVLVKRTRIRYKIALIILAICVGLAFFNISFLVQKLAPVIRSRLPTLLTRPSPTTMVYSTKPAIAAGEPKLSAKEEREWNHMAEGMEYYHNHFRHSFDSIYEMADGKFHTRGLSLQHFLREARSLYSHLEMHHSIEERHIFPILARKMPQFKAGARESGAHLKSHKQIHAGMDKYLVLLNKYSADPTSYTPAELRGNMDSWRDVLFDHLTEEVQDLTGESMRKAGWTLSEVRGMPM